MLEELRELLRYRELVANLVRRELKLRYKNSVLGFFWSLLNPLLQILIITIVIKKVFKLPIDNYSAYLFAVILPWNAFQQSLLEGCASMLSNVTLIKRVYFPREALVISSVLSNIFHLLIAFGIFFIYLALLPVKLHLVILWLPVIILGQMMLTLGLSLILACINVFFEDVRYILTVVLNLLFYAVPIMYPVEMVPAKYYTWYMLNPVASFIVAYRKVMLPANWLRTIPPRPFDSWNLIYACSLSALILIIGYAVFNRLKWLIPERM